MPFTLIHMGPGAAFKALGGRRFSLMVFGFSQAAMDVEPLVRMVRGDSVIHGVTHTYLGAAAIALISLVIGRPVCQGLLRAWNRSPRSGILARLQAPTTIPWSAAAVAALVGTVSHVALDSVMHTDMQPLLPFFAGNGLWGVLAVESLQNLCLALAAGGLAVLALALLLQRPGLRGEGR